MIVRSQNDVVDAVILMCIIPFILVMGASNSLMYKNGDIPRDTISILSCGGCGYAYYLSSMQGNCSICLEPTKYWFVNIKSRGKFLCEPCHSNPINSKIDVDMIAESLKRFNGSD